MEKCDICHKLSVDHDYNYLTVGGQDFRVDVYYCTSCQSYRIETELLSDETKKMLSERIKRMFLTGY